MSKFRVLQSSTENPEVLPEIKKGQIIFVKKEDGKLKLLYDFEDDDRRTSEFAGPQGPQGYKGDTGEQGLQGPQGPQGETGYIDPSLFESTNELGSDEYLLQRDGTDEKKIKLYEPGNIVTRLYVKDLKNNSFIPVGAKYKIQNKESIEVNAGDLWTDLFNKDWDRVLSLFGGKDPDTQKIVFGAYLDHGYSSPSALSHQFAWVEGVWEVAPEDLANNILGTVLYDLEHGLFASFSAMPNIPGANDPNCWIAQNTYFEWQSEGFELTEPIKDLIYPLIDEKISEIPAPTCAIEDVLVDDISVVENKVAKIVLPVIPTYESTTELGNDEFLLNRDSNENKKLRLYEKKNKTYLVNLEVGTLIPQGSKIKSDNVNILQIETEHYAEIYIRNLANTTSFGIDTFYYNGNTGVEVYPGNPFDLTTKGFPGYTFNPIRKNGIWEIDNPEENFWFEFIEDSEIEYKKLHPLDTFLPTLYVEFPGESLDGPEFKLTEPIKDLIYPLIDEKIGNIPIPESKIEDVQVNGSSVVDANGVADIELIAENIFYDNSKTPLKIHNVQDALDISDDLMRYNAIFVWDVTMLTFPPNTMRDSRWHIQLTGPVVTPASYMRYYYDNIEDAQLDTKGDPNIANAAAARRQEGLRVWFEYLENGAISKIVELSDVSGNVLIDENFRPVPRGDVWFYGANQAEGVPKDGVILDFVDVNVATLTNMIGLEIGGDGSGPLTLDTVAQQIIPAVNEVNAKADVVAHHEELDVILAQQYSVNNPGILTWVEKA